MRSSPARTSCLAAALFLKKKTARERRHSHLKQQSRPSGKEAEKEKDQWNDPLKKEENKDEQKHEAIPLEEHTHVHHGRRQKRKEYL